MSNMRAIEPVYLRNVQAYLRWSKRVGWPSFGPLWGDTEKARRLERRAYLLAMAPAEFPCFALALVTSCAYEESEPFYLYRDALAGMLSRLEPAQKKDAHHE